MWKVAAVSRHRAGFSLSCLASISCPVKRQTASKVKGGRMGIPDFQIRWATFCLCRGPKQYEAR